MKVLLTGGTGFVGSHLTARLLQAGHKVSIVSRRPGSEFDWGEDSLRRGVAEADAIVHLSGEGLFAKRWTRKQKGILRSSRIETTRRLAKLAAGYGTNVFLSGSAVGYYGPCESLELTETAPAGNDFLAQLCVDWEAATAPATEAGVQTAIVRIGVVLGLEGGALNKMMMPFRLGLGGPLGNGWQWVSWIHIDDLCALFQFLLERDGESGAYNASAPAPVRFREFARELGVSLRRPAILPVPAFGLRLVLGEVADVLLTGQHVVPKRALESGFNFKHQTLELALRDLLQSVE